MWSSQICKGCSKVGIASYKFSVIINKVEELLNLFLGLRLRPLTNSCYFFGISADTLCRYNIPKIIYRAQAKGTLWLLSIKIVLLKLLQDPTNVLLIFVWGFTNNKEIIKVDHAVGSRYFHRILLIMCYNVASAFTSTKGITGYSYNPQWL